jgi:hypothetical protein
LRKDVDVVAMTERAIVANTIHAVQAMDRITKCVEAPSGRAGLHPVDLEEPEEKIHLLPRKNGMWQVGQKIKDACL